MYHISSIKCLFWIITLFETINTYHCCVNKCLTILNTLFGGVVRGVPRSTCYHLTKFYHILLFNCETTVNVGDASINCIEILR